MPWTITDAKKKNSTLTDGEVNVWVQVANKTLEGCTAKGGTECDSMAIRSANAVIDRNRQRKTKVREEGANKEMNKDTRLFEAITMTGSNVDREHGVIRNIVLLNEISVNNKVYPKTTREEATPLFEGKKCYDNHGNMTGKDGRPIREMIGVFRQSRFEGGKNKADLHLFDGELKEKILSIAEKGPESCGFSLDGNGKTRWSDGKMIVDKITRVNSVDLVGDPATTTSLFESRPQYSHSPGMPTGIAAARRRCSKILALSKIASRSS